MLYIGYFIIVNGWNIKKKNCLKNSIAFGKAPRREANSQPVKQASSQSGNRLGKQASRQAGRNTQFGFFSIADYIAKQYGTLDRPRQSSGRTLAFRLRPQNLESRWRSPTRVSRPITLFQPALVQILPSTHF